MAAASDAPTGPLPPEQAVGPAGLGLVARDGAGDGLASRVSTAAFAFRGYDLTNQGRSHELLAHHAYGPVVRALLEEAAAICSEAIGERVDLVARVRDREPSTLATYAATVEAGAFRVLLAWKSL